MAARRDIAREKWEQLVDQRRRSFLSDVREPVSEKDLLDQLKMLTTIAEDTINTDPMREEAEKLLLRWIGDPVIAEAFYEVRRFCS